MDKALANAGAERLSLSWRFGTNQKESDMGMPFFLQGTLSFLLTGVFLCLTGCIAPCAIKGADCAPSSADQGSIKLLPSATPAPVTSAGATKTEPSNTELTEPAPWIEPSPLNPTIIQDSLTLAPGETRAVTVPVNGSVVLFFLHGAQPLTVTLADPTGWVIDAAVAAQQPMRIMHYALPGNMFSAAGWSVQYQVVKPVTGDWQVIITTEAANRLILYGAVKSSRQIRIKFDKASYRPGELVTVEASLEEDERPQIGALITGTLILPDGAQFPLSFADEGAQGDVTAQDGLYTAQFTAPHYNSRPELDLHATYEDVLRKERTDIEVVGPTATLQQISGERAVDTNSNGLYERLELDLLLAVQTAGAYEFQGTLVDNSGKQLAFAMSEISFNALTTGMQTVTLAFDGAMLHSAGRDGPYTLTNLLIKHTDRTVYASFTVGFQQNVYTTATYDHRQFED